MCNVKKICKLCFSSMRFHVLEFRESMYCHLGSREHSTVEIFRITTKNFIDLLRFRNISPKHDSKFVLVLVFSFKNSNMKQEKVTGKAEIGNP